MHTRHGNSAASTITPITNNMRRLILGVVLGLAALNGASAASSNTNDSLDERGIHEGGGLFNPAIAAAAFKVGLTNIASSNTRSSNKRANAFGKQHGSTHTTKNKNKRTPQVLGDLLGADGDVFDGSNGVNIILLEGGTVTSGSVSTVRVVPTTYTTTVGGERSESRIHYSLIYSLYTSLYTTFHHSLLHSLTGLRIPYSPFSLPILFAFFASHAPLFYATSTNATSISLPSFLSFDSIT